MKNSLSLNLRSYWAGFKAIVVFTVVVIVYTIAVTLVGQLAFPDQANGSMIKNESGEVVGSSLIGQSFTDADGKALPQYFQSRPSATSDDDGNAAPYNAVASTGSNLGHADEGLIKDVIARRDAIAKLENVNPNDVPPEATTSSSSGLDPQISLKYAEMQVPRVAKERGMSEDAVRKLVYKNTTHRGLGYIAEDAVNVVTLNLALDEAE